MKKNNGFISMTLVYTFLILFLFLMLAILNAYTQKNKFLEGINNTLYKDVREYVIDYSGKSWDFAYTGTSQTFKAPETGYYKIELWGASGSATTGVAGKGAYTKGIIKLMKNEEIILYIGQQGINDSVTTCYNSGIGNNGGYSGGGATDIRLVGGEWNTENSLISRIMVAAGGGSTSTGVAGDGGMLFGLDGSGTQGATQLAASEPSAPSYSGSTFGISGGGCSGGNGYYAAGGSLCSTGSGGGSSYISGYAGVSSVDNNSETITNNNETRHYSGKYFISTLMKPGVNTGNGRAAITYVSYAKPTRINSALDNVRYIKDCSTGSTSNAYSIWMELQAIYEGRNIIKDKVLTGVSNVSFITDGDISATLSPGYGTLSVPSGSNACLTIDLGDSYDLDEIAVWNYYPNGRTFYDAVTFTSSNGINYTPVINEIYPEQSNGKRVNAYEEINEGYVGTDVVLLFDGISNLGTKTHSTSTTTWKDLSGNGNDAILTNFAMASGSGWENSSLQFDGTDDNAVTTVGTDFSTFVSGKSFTYCTTFKTEASALNQWSGLLSNMPTWGTGGFNMQYGTAQGLALGGMGDAYLKTNVAPSTDTNYNLCGVYDGSTMKVYLNGENKGQLPAALTAGNSSFTLGVFYALPNSLFMKGKIYSVKIYERTLSEKEILNNYNIDKLRFGI